MATSDKTGWSSSPAFIVHVIDMEYGTKQGHDIAGFASLEAAREYAKRRTCDSVEVLRAVKSDADELRRMWSAYGEDCVVVDDDYRGANDLEFFIAHPASKGERDYASLEPSAETFDEVASHAITLWQQRIASDRQPGAGAFQLRATKTVHENAPDEEFHETARNWSLVLDGATVVFRRWLNQASIAGAEQTEEMMAGGPRNALAPQSTLDWLISLERVIGTEKFTCSVTGDVPRSPDAPAPESPPEPRGKLRITGWRPWMILAVLVIVGIPLKLLDLLRSFLTWLVSRRKPGDDDGRR